MASILDWQRAGVDIKVEVNKNKPLVYAEISTPRPFEPGGPSDGNGGNYPLGWARDPVPNSSGNMINTVAGGIWGSRYSSLVTTLSPRLGATDIPGAANRRYAFYVDVRQMAGMDDTAYTLRMAELNPTNGAVNTLTEIINVPISSTTFDRLVLVAPRALDWANGYTSVRISLGGANYISGGSHKWGVEWQNPVLVTRDTNLTQSWKDITCDVRALNIRYGRERFTERFDTATLGLELVNTDGEYSYANPHPFNFGPGRAVRVTATYQSGTYPLAYGIIDQCNDGVTLDGLAITTVQCLDPQTLLASTPTPTVINSAGLSARGRISALIALTGYPFVDLDPAVAGWTMQAIQGSGRSIRDEIGVTSDSEGGATFAERDGRIMYKNRNWLSTDVNTTQVTATFNARPREAESQEPPDTWPEQVGAPSYCPNGLVTDWSMARVINDLELANAGGTAQRWELEDSIRDNGRRTYTRTDFVLQSSALLPTRATDILTGNDQPKLRLNSLTYRPDLETNNWVWTLSVFLRWLVRVWYQNSRNGWGWLLITHVQSIEHRITPTEWHTELALDEPVYYADAPMSAAILWDHGGTWDTTAEWT